MDPESFYCFSRSCLIVFPFLYESVAYLVLQFYSLSVWIKSLTTVQSGLNFKSTVKILGLWSFIPYGQKQ